MYSAYNNSSTYANKNTIYKNQTNAYIEFTTEQTTHKKRLQYLFYTVLTAHDEINYLKFI